MAVQLDGRPGAEWRDNSSGKQLLEYSAIRKTSCVQQLSQGPPAEVKRYINCFRLPSSDLTLERLTGGQKVGCVKERECLCEVWLGWEDMLYPGPAAIMCIQLSCTTPFFSGQADGTEVLG